MRWRGLALRHGWLALVCAAYATASLVVCPHWLMAKYPHLAERLRAGVLGPAEAADASPGYLLLHALIAPDTVRWLQLAAGVATLVAVHAVAMRVRGPVAAVIATTLLAATQSWIVYSAVLEPDLLIAALHAFALAALLGGSTVGRSSVAGLVLGAACALRPTSAVVAIAALIWTLRDDARKPRRAHAAAFLLAMVTAALLPGAVLHLRTRHDARATMSAGQVFHQGHRPGDVGLRAHYPLLIKLLEAHRGTQPDAPPDYAHQLYRKLAGGERAWIERALAFARAEPGAFARQLGRKWLATLVAPSPGADIAGVVAVVQSRPGFPWLPTHIVALAGFAGLLLVLFPRARATGLIAQLVVLGQLVAVVFYHQQRYGLALLPLWCLLAACALASLWAARRFPLHLTLRVLAVASPFLLLTLPWVRFEHRLEARRLEVPAQSPIPALRAAGQIAAARAQFIEEQAAFPDLFWPWSPRGHGLRADSPLTALAAADRARERFGSGDPVDDFLLAALYAHGGRCDRALPLADHAARAGFHAALEDTEVVLDPDLLASDCLLRLGRGGEARARIARSLARTPGTLDALARAVAAGMTEHEPALRALHDPASVAFALARARRTWGDPNGALADASRLAELVPEAAPLAAHERALALLDLGLTEDALAAYARSLAVGYFVYGSSRFDEPIRAHPGLEALARRHAARQGW